eukprot:3891951-Pyramimonas_sp.AAC.1
MEAKASSGSGGGWYSGASPARASPTRLSFAPIPCCFGEHELTTTAADDALGPLRSFGFETAWDMVHSWFF